MNSKIEARLAELERRVEALEDENQYLKQILAHMPGHICWKGLDGKYLGCNENVARLVKVSSPEEFIGMTLYDFCDKELADTVNAVDESIMREGKEKSVEEEAFDVNGNKAFYLTHKSPLYDKHRNVNGMSVVSLDITRLKNTEKALIEAKEKAEAANNAKSEFLRNISHDLRTPFNGILSFSDYLLSSEENPTKKEMLECINVSTRKLIDIVNEILAFTKTDHEQLPLRKQPLDIRKIVDATHHLVVSQLKEKNLNFIVNCSPQIPQSLVGDEARIARILLNLVVNAIKFTAKGQIKVEINLANQKKDTAFIDLKIIDTGIGIPADKYDFIFEKFGRLTYSDSSDYEGLGLGLYIVKKFITELHGTIQVESTVGKGSTFICQIPLTLL